MRVARRFALIFGLASLAAGHVMAQEPGSISIRAYGGGLHSVGKIHVNDVYRTKFGTGFGGGIGYQISEVFTLRGEALTTRSTLSFYDADLADKLERTYASVIAQFQLPSNRVRPYLLTGLGATFLSQPTPHHPDNTYGHWVGGAGVRYFVGSSGLSLAAEGRLHVYDAKNLIGTNGNNRLLSDAALTLGFVYQVR